eukprot:365733-Chlamydomonas_euryale.AAC.6
MSIAGSWHEALSHTCPGHRNGAIPNQTIVAGATPDAQLLSFPISFFKPSSSPPDVDVKLGVGLLTPQKWSSAVSNVRSTHTDGSLEHIDMH